MSRLRCGTCVFYNREDQWGGTCTIEIPPWLPGANTVEEDRNVRPDEYCDLGKIDPTYEEGET